MTRKDFKMFKMTSLTVLSLSAAVALTAVTVPQMAQAQPSAATAQVKVSDTTDISARRYYRRGYRNDAAGLAFAGIVLGTVGALVANQQRQEYYRQNYYYGGNPYYGGGYYSPY